MKEWPILYSPDMALWESINGTWNREQWVWAIEFKVLEGVAQ